MNAYEYATGDRLENRNTYYYSPYVGHHLFICWKQQRDESLRRKSSKTPPLESKETPTDLLLAVLQTSLARGVAGPDEWMKIDKLLQRFEVTKRLHGEYKTDWRPVDPADYQGIEAYLRFAELMDQAYQSSVKLQYLNVFLKSMDTLTAHAGVLDVQQINRLERLISREREHVESLAQKIGVTLAESLT